MNTKMILFDLDGTLLPMDMDVFIKAYFGGIARRLAAYGYESEKLVKSIWTGTMQMVKNNGEKTNEQVFWDTFASIYGGQVRDDEALFEEFYHKDFDKVQASCSYTAKAAETVKALKAMGFRLALATNPIFPAIATKKRIAWAGLNEGDFELVTTYENSSYCKPNLAYYQSVTDRLGVSPTECLMVGNDVTEDMVAQKLGMKVFLLTDCIINKDGADISAYPHGSFEELIEYVKTLA